MDVVILVSLLFDLNFCTDLIELLYLESKSYIFKVNRNGDNKYS